MQNTYLSLADAVLLLHAVIVFFNVGSLPLIWLGHFLRWEFVRNFYFRTAHLLLLVVITAEAVFGTICPLTAWEDELRVRGGADPRYAGSYIGHWVGRLIFYDVDQRVFAVGYVGFLLLVVFTFIRVKPRTPRWLARKKAEP
jgi:hypothetical protein